MDKILPDFPHLGRETLGGSNSVISEIKQRPGNLERDIPSPALPDQCETKPLPSWVIHPLSTTDQVKLKCVFLDRNLELQRYLKNFKVL